MYRSLAILGFVVATGLYAWKDWFKGLCGLILLMAVVEHPDMPKTILGIQGLNPWNALLLDVVLAWLAQRRRERLKWDLPTHVSLALLLYVGVVVTAFLRMMFDRGYADFWSTGELISDHFVNPIKFIVPGLLLFDGCRSRKRFGLAIASTIGLYLVLAVQVIKWVPPTTDADELERRSRRRLDKEIGYHRVDLSTMLAGASWSILAAAPLFPQRSRRMFAYAAAGGVVYAQALTAGRSGYVAWAVVGLALSTLRWRRYLLLAPVGVMVIALAVPAVVGRFRAGLSSDDDAMGESSVDETTITAGRNLIWAAVIEQIREAPWLGRGRLAFIRTGLHLHKTESDPEGVLNPHSAYLEQLLDNGIVGLCLLMPFFLIALWHGLRMFRDSRSAVFVAAGGMASALVIAQLAGGVTGQTFYPREGMVGMWCAIGLLMRVYVEREHAVALAQAQAAEPADSSAPPESAARPGRTRPARRPRRTSRRKRPVLPALDGFLWARS